MKTTTAMTTIGLGLLLAEEVYAGPIEVMTGIKSTTLDAQISGPIIGSTGFLLRNRTTIPYEGKVSIFQLGDITYALGNGFDAVAELQVALTQDSSIIMPRLGAHYYHNFGTIEMDSVVTIDSQYAELDAFVQYRPKITNTINGFAKIETIQDIGLQGYVFGTELTRLGVDVKGYKTGLALDVTHPDTTCNLGLFVLKSF
ncbi:MAG: hypothetical protein WC254_07435 [Candidatus Woesearchaeota archaeon]|jgi:hypothetical protein